MTIGERIKAARKKAGMTQRGLAEKLGISEQGIAQWENGVRNAKLGTIKKIAEALDVPFEALIYVDDEERSNTINKEDSNNNLAALGIAMGAMGMGNRQMGQSDTHREADKTCVKALASMAETMDALNNLVKSIQGLEKQDEFDYENAAELTGKMATLATSMSTLRMSMGLGTPPFMPGAGYPTA